MLHYLRQLRRHLFAENRFGKYLLYVVLEVFIVIVGILIAINVDAWNEEKSRRSREIEILRTMSDFLDQDITQLKRSIPFNQRIRETIDTLLLYFQKDLPYRDSLKYLFGNTINHYPAMIKTSAFENLKSEGINLISDDSLRNRIVEYYDVGSDNLISLSGRYLAIIESAGINVFNTRFQSMWESNYDDWIQEQINPQNKLELMQIQGELVPRDFESLKRDEEYVYFIKFLKNANKWYMDRPLRLKLKSARGLKNQIDNELERLE